MDLQFSLQTLQTQRLPLRLRLQKMLWKLQDQCRRVLHMHTAWLCHVVDLVLSVFLLQVAVHETKRKRTTILQKNCSTTKSEQLAFWQKNTRIEKIRRIKLLRKLQQAVTSSFAETQILQSILKALFRKILHQTTVLNLELLENN